MLFFVLIANDSKKQEIDTIYGKVIAKIAVSNWSQCKVVIMKVARSIFDVLCNYPG